MNVKHCSTDESCRSIVYSEASDISFGGYIVGTPINIVHGMWFGVERIPVNLWELLGWRSPPTNSSKGEILCVAFKRTKLYLVVAYM